MKKIRKNQEKIRKNQEKSGKIGEKTGLLGEHGSITIPLRPRAQLSPIHEGNKAFGRSFRKFFANWSVLAGNMFLG